MSRVYAGLGKVLPEELTGLREEAAALARFDGVVFGDPEDGLEPAFLAAELCRIHPSIRVVLPLVARDRNRTALLSAARTATAMRAQGLVLLSGRLDPASPARTVYELDPAQMLETLQLKHLGGELWVSSGCSTAAERARVRRLAKLGASRCVVPWCSEDPPAPCEALSTVFHVEEADWGAGRFPPRDFDQVLQVVTGRGAAAQQALRARS